ncbi:hypothetical protein ACTHO0_20980 [Cytobacillus praedii]|uniref:hypothetical protein n=1 Tax=Cytobacillus praedii TaxID=1742358 RepID=UPI003F7E3941
MPTYNKLVRDRIPEIIEKTGKQFSMKIKDNTEYIKELKKKSFEELEEYVNTTNKEEAIEELADVIEIIHALAAYHGHYNKFIREAGVHYGCLLLFNYITSNVKIVYIYKNNIQIRWARNERINAKNNRV